jgi:nitronate monooxygenase
MSTSYPTVIQGGLGVGVSNWRLARAVSSLGQLGVVSGTALDQVFVRRLQDGDPGGHMRFGLDHFPLPEMAERLWQKYYIPGGKEAGKPYAMPPMQAKDGPREFRELCIVANFIEVFLARQGHDNPVGVNFMEKLQPPHLPSIYGTMLGGVSYVLMGAGIPMKIPGVLDRYVRHEEATYPLTVSGAKEGDDTLMRFNPKDYLPIDLPDLQRPKFLAIIASSVLAVTLTKKATGKVDGFIIEGPTAGGHNAPPRGQLQLNERGEPVYGERDVVDLPKIATLGLPFWLAGGFGSPEGLQEALAQGAAGVQVGTAFALCDESAMAEDTKRQVLDTVLDKTVSVFTDPNASPTGFPFKIAQVKGSISEVDVYLARPRVCDLGYLREAYRTEEGEIGYRCAAEVPATYAAKGGEEQTEGRKCICNALLAAIGQPQRRGKRHVEPVVVTSGDDLTEVGRFVPDGARSYSAQDVIRTMLGDTRPVIKSGQNV